MGRGRAGPRARARAEWPYASRRAAALLLACLVVAVIGLPSAAPRAAAQTSVTGDDRRLTADEPVAAAVEVSRSRFPRDGTAALVVLARADLFADALASSPLLGDGPLLLTPGAALDPAVAAELDRVLADGGEVLVAGGAAAVGDPVVRAVADLGHRVGRVAGTDRIATALAFADEVLARGGSSDEVLLARAAGPGTAAWADSVAVAPYAAAQRVPVLLTRTEGLDPPVADWLASTGTSRTVVLGGEAALSAEVAAAVPGGRRVAGVEREATAAAVARELVGIEGGPRRAVAVFDNHAPDGWAWGLVGASAVADAGGALLGVLGDGDAVAPAAGPAALRGPAAPLLGGCVGGGPGVVVDLLVSAARASISDVLADRLVRLDGSCPSPDGTSAEGWAVSGVHVGPVGTGATATYSVEVEPATGVALGELREVLVDALLDPRGWGRTRTLVQVGPGEPADVRIVLARPATVDAFCGRAGLRTAGRFSCWDGRRAMLNLDRYLTGARDFGGEVTTYRRYLVNHEVGHGLGHGHVGCPAPGALAPVMMQQTKSTGACVPNGWPFP